jgi:hypothetical protein
MKKTTYSKVIRSDNDWERIAITYVKWVANRRDIELPNRCECPCIKVCWSSVGLSTQTKTGRYRYERRIRSVCWGHKEEVYNIRKDKKQGAYLYTKFVTELEIELPFWDWQPEVIDTSVNTSVSDLSMSENV